MENTDEFKEELLAQREELTAAIEELERKNQELEQSVDELAKRNLELDHIIYRTNHDLKSPITTIHGIVYLLRNELKDSDLNQYLDLIEKNVTTQKGFIYTMVDMARNLRSEIIAESFDFLELKAEIIEDKEQILDHEKVELLFESSGKIELHTDRNRLRGVLYNLISNCIHFRDDRKPSFAKVSCERIDDLTIIRVSDNGLGMKDDIKNKAFNMFYRGSEHSSGSGLGLYLSKRIVEILQGELKFESNYGEGTIITIKIPDYRSE